MRILSYIILLQHQDFSGWFCMNPSTIQMILFKLSLPFIISVLIIP